MRVDHGDAALSSQLAYPEVRAALAAAGRNRDLDRRGLVAALETREQLWAAVRPVELTPDIARHAGELASRHAG